jgi:HEAT repeat protein
MKKRDQEKIEKLIRSFADHEPVVGNLGTAFPIDSEATETLVRMGQPAIPTLVKSLDSENPKIVLYAVYCLGQMGDSSVLPALKQTVERHSSKEPKEEFDFAIISTASRAIDSLSESSKSE